MAKLIYFENRVWIETPYAKPFVDALKINIPNSYRTWQPYDKVWIVYAPYIERARELVKTYFSPVTEENVEAFEQAEQRQKEQERQRAEERERRQREYDTDGFWSQFGSHRNRYGNQDTHRTHQNRSGATNTPTPDSDPYATLFVVRSAPREVIDAAYRALSRMQHPDLGGTTEQMQRLNGAKDAIYRQKGW